VSGTKSSKAALVLLVLLNIGFGTMTSYAQSPDHIQLATFDDPPHIMVDGDKTQGLAVSIVERLFKLVGLTFELQVMPPKRTVIYATQQENACVFPIERNQEREALFSWVGPILVTRTGFYANATDELPTKIETLMDAKQYVIGSHLGSGTGEYLQSLGFKVDFIPENISNAYKLKAKRIDLWETDQLTAAYASKVAKIELSPSHLDFFTNLRGIGCNPAIPEAIIEKMRSVLHDMYKTGGVERIQHSYMSLP
jgi:polar amino acid transport system substrate-binding protein